ncbi:MAG TPA: DUF3311 domain-containing protein [Candidatus Dormibacteraeota bacterium]|nr:DUF3311 domain-containing protein [Candidatus Dormibacteraeota bacterium]
MRSRKWALLLLIVPFVSVLYPDWYSRLQPELAGIPFFVWYQFAMVVLGVIVTLGVYALEGVRR